jgi:hypothetical protein
MDRMDRVDEEPAVVRYAVLHFKLHAIHEMMDANGHSQP